MTYGSNYNRNRKVPVEVKAALTVGLIWLLLLVAFWGTIAYVAWHFIAKAW